MQELDISSEESLVVVLVKLEVAMGLCIDLRQYPRCIQGRRKVDRTGALRNEDRPHEQEQRQHEQPNCSHTADQVENQRRTNSCTAFEKSREPRSRLASSVGESRVAGTYRRNARAQTTHGMIPVGITQTLHVA